LAAWIDANSFLFSVQGRYDNAFNPAVHALFEGHHEGFNACSVEPKQLLRDALFPRACQPLPGGNFCFKGRVRGILL
jgi:hypothetical protein